VSFDQFYDLARQVDAQFGLIDLGKRTNRDPVAAASVLRSVGNN